MQIKSSTKQKENNNQLNRNELSNEKKVDINILLNRVKNEKKNVIKKNFIITFGVAGSLLITGLITAL
tara:strand:+ start:1208 stop:1411 length:204 start_codon:yes stop_codon:yes gene_type:complete